jgi:fumarylacetoacetate (FAA) hydrolase
MKLVTLKANPSDRNGKLAVVSKDLTRGVLATGIAPNLVDALWHWTTAKPALESLYRQLNEGKASEAFPLNLGDCLAPLPFAPGFYDGSAFLSHVVRARRARGDEMPASAKITPLMYQGVSDFLLPWNAPISIMDKAYGGDFEGEFAVITTSVPRGVSAEKASSHIALITLFNDITLREIVKTEIETKFGFLQSKPNSSFAPVVVTPDELEGAWKQGRVHLDMAVSYNGKPFGKPNGREMHFSFEQLIAHAARTRPLAPGTIVGAGTVSNEDKNAGFACLTEKRFQEVLDEGRASTRWLEPGDTVKIEVFQGSENVFGSIEEVVTL